MSGALIGLLRPRRQPAPGIHLLVFGYGSGGRATAATS
jgi:hypothetical protein